MKEKLITLFPKVFSDKIGRLKDREAVIHIDPNVKPVKQKLRPIPIYLKDAVVKELENLEKQGVIEKVNGPTTWVTSIVPVVKRKPTATSPIEVRICTDSRDSNKAIVRERYKMPTIDEMLTKLHGAKVFSKIDLKKAYFQVGLAKECRYLNAFNTPKGVMQWCVLNMGMSASSEIFQKIMEETMEGLDGQICISDDLIVFGKDDDEHWKNMLKIMERLEKAGLTVNREKCAIAKRELDFFGFHFSGDGMSITDEKYKALMDAEIPKSASELRSLLGLSQYVERVAVPNLVQIVEPLRKLIKRESLTIGRIFTRLHLSSSKKPS